MNLLSIVWDWNPTLIMLGNLDIRWYGLMWAIAILVAERILAYAYKREGLPPRTIESAFLWIVLGTFIGARVGHCLFYEPEVYLAEPWRIITGIRDGGMASHGATIGIIIGVFGFARRNNLPFIWGMDRIAIVAPLSGAVIRFGNLFNSEIVGYPTDAAWGFKFVRHDAYRAFVEYNGDVPAEILDTIPARHPAQLYEALCHLCRGDVSLLWQGHGSPSSRCAYQHCTNRHLYIAFLHRVLEGAPGRFRGGYVVGYGSVAQHSIHCYWCYNTRNSFASPRGQGSRRSSKPCKQDVR